MLRLIKIIFCSHHNFKWYRNIYGDEINRLNARSIWECKCGKFKLKNTPHDMYRDGIRRNKIFILLRSIKNV